MDTERLLRVLNDIYEDEKANGYAALYKNLAANVTANTPEGLAQAETIREEIEEQLKNSDIDELPPSYHGMIKAIEGEAFVGENALIAIRAIFESGPLTLAAGLTNYASNYEAFIARVNQGITSLENLGIVAYDGDFFEVGFIIPGEYDDLLDVVGHLEKIDTFMRVCSQIAGDKDNVTRLKGVSNGSNGFFLAQTVGAASVAFVVLKHLLILYQEFLKTKKLQAEINEVNTRTAVNKSQILLDLTKVQNELQDDCLHAAVDEVMADHFNGPSVEKARLHSELEVATRILMQEIQAGIKVEVAPPVSDEDSESEPQTQKQQKATEAIPELSKELQKLYSTAAKTQERLPFDVKVLSSEINAVQASQKRTDATRLKKQTAEKKPKIKPKSKPKTTKKKQ